MSGLNFIYRDEEDNEIIREINYLNDTLQLPHIEGDSVVEINLLPSTDGTISTALQGMGMGRLVASCESYAEDYTVYIELMELMVNCVEGKLIFPGGFVLHNCVIQNMSPPVQQLDGIHFNIKFMEV